MLQTLSLMTVGQGHRALMKAIRVTHSLDSAAEVGYAYGRAEGEPSVEPG